MDSGCSEVSEYVSRWARWRLVCACIKELVKREERIVSRRRRGATRFLLVWLVSPVGLFRDGLGTGFRVVT